ncbi:MAG: hypothetical protein IPP49_12100 [Saprospiraceae bacterium]|nr:hypothetical protein [Saprospiraceae bacterium]
MEDIRVLIFIYVLVGGLTVPLKSGITSTDPGNALSGEHLALKIHGYNSHFYSAKKTGAG